MAAQKLDVFPELYRKAALVLPMTVVERPGHAGVTSCSFFIEFRDATSGSLYARIQRQIVTIDAVTRKPLPVQRGHRGFDDGSYSAKPIFVPQFTPTPDATTYVFKLCHSDSDDLGHTNGSTYIRLCCDAAANACNAGKLKNFSGDFFHYDVSSALIRYLGESFPGDELEVTVWEDHVELDCLYFHISNLKKLIFVAKFNYFNSLMSKM